MSAELLRRAAKTLRQHAENATGPGPWAWEATGQQGNSWGLGQMVDADGEPLAGDVTDVEGTEVVESICYQEDDNGNLSDPAYIALMHPPVALALADLLEAHIPLFDGLDPAPDHEVFAVARAILREPEATP